MRRFLFTLALAAAAISPALLGACQHTVAESDKTTTNSLTGSTKTESTTVKEDMLGNQTVEHETHKSN